MSTSVPTIIPPSTRFVEARSSLVRALLGVLKVALVLLGGAALGLATTAVVLHKKIDPAAVTIGPWITWPKAGTKDIDPYARAVYADTGQVAFASAEGLAFTASTDMSGARLSTRCSYRIAGPFPPTRFWTLAVATPSGDVMDNPASRSAFTSSEILRRDDGGFDIVVSPSARPGNWLPLTGTGAVVLTLRLYDTPLASILGSSIKSTLMPAITPIGCQP